MLGASSAAGATPVPEQIIVGLFIVKQLSLSIILCVVAINRTDLVGYLVK